LLAFEAATFFGAGILRGALMHVVGRVFFEVELINEAEEHHGEGVALFLAGDLAGAQSCFEKAIAVDGRYAPSHLQMGVLCKVKNDLALAKTFFEAAQALDPEGETGQEAQQHLEQIQEA
jgi:tetratricopeptide (TPR) repeat protein